MLSAEKNERPTRVGPGTPMGELLRRYWWPIATHDMATRVPVKRRPLGEVPLTDDRGEWLRDYVDGQDIVAWITQGRYPTGRASTSAVRTWA